MNDQLEVIHKTDTPIAIIAGAGDLPSQVAEAVTNSGRSVHIIGIDGETDKEIEAWDHDWVHFGEVGRFLDLLKSKNCKELVLIGKVNRPNIKDVKFDFGAFRTLPKILSRLLGGDGEVLDSIVQVLADNGVKVVGAHEVAPDLLLSQTRLGKLKPNRQQQKDIELGIEIAQQIGSYDIAQGVVVYNGRVIAVEAVEGTDRMLERCASLNSGKSKSHNGVLVKSPKPQQDLRIDMPTIGPKTIQLAKEAGLCGISVAANATLISNIDQVRKMADSSKLFVVGHGHNL